MWTQEFLFAVCAIPLGAALYSLNLEGVGSILAGGVSCVAAFVCFVLLAGEELLLPVPTVILATVTVVAAIVIRVTDPGTSHRYPAAAAGVLLAAAVTAAPLGVLAPALGGAAGGALVLTLRRGDPVALARVVAPAWTVLTMAGSVGFAMEYMALLVPVFAAATPERRAPRWLAALRSTWQSLIGLLAFGMLIATAAGMLPPRAGLWDPAPMVFGAAGWAALALGNGIIRATRDSESISRPRRFGISMPPPLRLMPDTALVCAAGASWIGVAVGVGVLQLTLSGALLIGTAAGAAVALYARSVTRRMWIWCAVAWALAATAHALLEGDVAKTPVALLMLGVAATLPLTPERPADVRRD